MSSEISEKDDIPTQKELYEMVLKLSLKVERLEKELNTIKTRKKTKKDIIKILSEEFPTPKILFANLTDAFIIKKEYINSIFELSVLETMKKYLQQNIEKFLVEKRILPINSFKDSTFVYVYDFNKETQKNEWMIMTDDIYQKFVSDIWCLYLKKYMTMEKDKKIPIETHDLNKKKMVDMRRLLIDKLKNEIKKTMHFLTKKEFI